MEIEQPNAERPKAKRRRFQFRLLLAILLMTLVCVIASWIGWRSHKDRLEAEQREDQPWKQGWSRHHNAIDDALVGKTESEIIGIYGKPDSDHDAEYRLTEPNYRPPPAGPLRILAWDVVDGGTLCAWLSKRDSEWRCFQSRLVSVYVPH